MSDENENDFDLPRMFGTALDKAEVLMAMQSAYLIFDAAVSAGFSEDQAMGILLQIFAAGNIRRE